MDPREEYMEKKKGFLRSLKFCTFIILISAIPLVGMYWGVFIKKSIFVAFFGIIWIIGMVYFERPLLLSLIAEAKELNAARKAYFETDEGAQYHKKTRRTRIILTTVISVALISVITAVIVTENVKTAEHTAKIEAAYTKAESLIAKNRFKNAEEELLSIKEEKYKDTESLIALCRAHIEYDKGYLASAYSEIDDVTFQYQSSEQLRAIESFREKVSDKYHAESLARIRKELEEDEKIRNGVPFVGMLESRIADTSLGRPNSSVTHEEKIVDGVKYETNTYTFYSSNGKIIFVARCVNRIVKEVWDYRSDPITPTTKRGSSSLQPKDVFNADEYDDIDYFYEDHYDDFESFEDAEDYWNEYH